MDYVKKLDELRALSKELSEEKVRVETKLELEQKELARLEAEITKLGYKPEELENVIKDMELSLKKNLKK